MATRVPSRIGNFEVREILGRGGMGVCYLAWQPSLQRYVVLKALRRSVASDPSLEERFEREAQTAAAIHHQNVVGVYESLTWRGERYIAHEYVEGDDVADVLARTFRFDPRVAALIALSMARGLEEIHARGVVHRDLKPSNVLLGREGEVKIADFGIALDSNGPALTMPGLAVGTLPYMSPEQLLGEIVDARSDMFSLGVVLYELITGEVPFAAQGEEGEESLLKRIQAGRYEPIRKLAPDTPRWLSGIIKSCLQPHPDRRFRSITELRRALEEKLESPSPADARAEIAMWLWERNALRRPDDDMTEVLESESDEGPSFAWRMRWWAGSLVAATLLMGFVGISLRLGGDFQLPLLGTVLRPESGTLTVEASSGAEVRIDDGELLCTPLDAPVVLAAGPHDVVFEHSELGSHRQRIEVHAGRAHEVGYRFVNTPR